MGIQEGGYQSFVKQTCEDWVSAMTQNFKNNPLNIQIGKYHSIGSPREYNYSTDRIRFDVKFNLNELKKFCWKERRADFNDYLQKTWSSRSGFISFVPNNVVRFEYDYKNKDNRDLLIDIMLEWYFLEYIIFDKNAEEHINSYVINYDLSMKSKINLIKLARTIQDMHSDDKEVSDVSLCTAMNLMGSIPVKF